MMRVHQKIAVRLIAVSAFLLIAGFSAKALYTKYQKHILATLLRLETSPSSLRNVECESWGFTDILTTCAFEIDPVEFTALLRGWQFVETSASGNNYSFSGGPKVGPEFMVVVEYSTIDPKNFPDGGRISLVADQSRSKWQVDYYEE